MLTCDRLYTAAIVVGAALIPHLVLGLLDEWPAQAFNLHLVLALVLVGLGRRSDNLERATEAATEYDREFEQIARYLDNER